MLLVAIDTSGRNGSIALCRGDLREFAVLELIPLEGGTYSARLMPSIAQTLVRHGIDKTRLDGFVVVSGPGSFTGLRVGISTVKALCEVLKKPLAAVSMLEAIAIARSGPAGTVTVLVDAGRGEVYAGEYEISRNSAVMKREYMAKLAAIADNAPIEGQVVTPDAKIAEALQKHSAGVKLVTAVMADEIGRIGVRKLLAGDVADAATLDANYVRRSDAEIFSAPKH